MSIVLCLLICPLLARALIAWSRRKEQGIWPGGWVVGIAQDCFVAVVLFHFLCLFNLLNLTAFTSFFVAFAMVVAVIQIYHLVDAVLLHLVDIRMRFSFFWYLRDYQDFMSSAIEFGIRPILTTFCLLLLLMMVAMWMAKDALIASRFSVQMVLFGGISLAISLFGYWGRWKTRMYLFSNCLFREGADFLLKLFASEKEGGQEGWIIKSQCEDYRTIAPHYPLLKMTTGFTGKKLFNIRIEKEERPHVIVIALESFGAKHLGCLGNPYGASPQCDRLAKDGLLFSNFHAAGIPTARSLLATLFGIYPDLDPFSLQERYPLYPLIGIQSLLKQQGYRTIYHKGGSIAFLNARNYLENHDFDEIAGDEKIAASLGNSVRTSWGVHDEQLFEFSFQRLKRQDATGVPAFMMLCTLSNHHPWQVPSGFDAPTFDIPKKPLYSQYLQAYYYCDAMLGRFIDKLRAEGISERCIILVTADNAQPMGEHGDNFMPLRGVYEENHHIPLLILADGRIQQPQVIAEPGSQIDLLPTIMDILNLQGINHSIGTSLVKHAPERHIFCVSPHILPFVSHQQGKYKYCVELESDQRELFDLEEDPEEKSNVLETYPHIADKLHTQLINHFTSLQRLYVENRITSATQQSLAYIGDGELTDKVLGEAAEKLKELQSVLISDCDQVTDDGILHLAQKANQLEFLFLDKLHISDESLIALEGKTSHLKELTLSHCLGVSSECVAHFLSNCPELLELTLTGSLQLEDAVLEAIATGCPKINNLELPECYCMTDQGFEALASGLSNLVRLNLQGVTQITDITLEILSKGRYQLRSLHLLECPGVTEEGLLTMTKTNPKLQRLSFSATHVGNEALQQIVSHCPDIIKLCIYDCQHITEEGFLTIAENCHHLLMLELAGCPHLTDTFFRFLSEKHLDHLLIAAAPQVSAAALNYIKKISTLRTLVLTYCPAIDPSIAWKTAEEMHRTGLLHEITFNQSKKVFYEI